MFIVPLKNIQLVYLGSRRDSQHLRATTSAFRTILLGDINLLKEIRSHQSGSVGRRSLGAGVRWMYCAKLEGRDFERMTVAMYMGDGVEEVSSRRSRLAFLLMIISAMATAYRKI